MLLKAVVGVGGEEGVGGAFTADGGCRAVAGVDNGGVGEGEEVVLDGLDKLRSVAAGKVGASYGALEQCITCDYESVSPVVKGYAAGRMSRHMQNFKFSRADSDFIACFKVCVYRHVFNFFANAECVCLHLKPTAKKFIFLMSEHGNIESFLGK